MPAPAMWAAVSPAAFEYIAPDDAPDEDLRCCVCLGWPLDPVVLGCPGGHMLCRGCVSGPICPLDRQPFACFSPPQRPIVTLLGRLKVRCPQAKLGCAWTGPRANIAEHSAHCDFAEMVCCVCGTQMRRCDSRFAEHSHDEGIDSAVAAAGVSAAAVLATPMARRGGLRAAERREAISRIINIYEQAERLNVCFLVDCTGSMGGHISAVKTQINWIVHELRARLPSMHLHLAFVGYRDHCDSRRILTLPFTTSVTDFREFVAEIRATGGGGDGPEDVHGAVAEVLRLEWTIGEAATRVLIHIADYPAHGFKYNDCRCDSYPQGDPYNLDLDDMVRQLRNLSVQYTFGHITQHTQKMCNVLNEVLGEEYISGKNMASADLVAEVVASSVHTSVVSTVSTLTSSPGCVEDTPLVFSDEAPSWDTIPAKRVLLQDVVRVADASALLADADPVLTRKIVERRAEVRLATLPFSQGETRVVRHARLDGKDAVAKHFKKPVDDDGGLEVAIGASSLEAHVSLSEVSAVAGFLGEAFSAARPAGERVAFLPSAAASGDDVVPFTVEDALPCAEFKRFSNNLGWWEPDAPRVLMEFMRFTHEVTQGHMMVVDLQGVKTDDGWLLTDPCILCEDVERFGSGNMGPHAMDRCLSVLRVRLDEVPPALEVSQPSRSRNHDPDPNWTPSPQRSSTPWRPPNTAPVTPQDAKLDVDAMISALLAGKSKPGKYVDLAEDQILALVRVARDTLMRQPTLVELDSPINVVGDTHGQFHDVLRLFEAGGLPPDANYLMLGDYVDRGKQSMEVISLLFAFKVKYPDNFFILRGNHECASITRIYGFYDECKRRYNIKMWKTFCDAFNCLPPAALIDDKIFCMHGGPSAELNTFEDIRNIPRPTDVPDTGLLCDLLWADPDPGVNGWDFSGRGVSVIFGADVLEEMMPRLGIDLIARAHQVVEDGYEFFADRKLVTLFSAPNYCGEFNNAAALMQVKDDLMCSFKLVHGASGRK